MANGSDNGGIESSASGVLQSANQANRTVVERSRREDWERSDFEPTRQLETIKSQLKRWGLLRGAIENSKTHMKVYRNIALAAILGTQLSVGTTYAQNSDEVDIKALLRRIEELEQKVKIQERKLEIDKEAATEKAKTASSVSIGAGGFSVRSADTNFVLKVRGYMHADGRFFVNDASTGTRNDTFMMRRVRPIIEGTVYEKYDYRIMLDFPSNASLSSGNNALVQDAYMTARFRPDFQISVGKMKEPVGLERLQSAANLLFIERGYPTQLLPNRDVGLQIHGDVLNNTLSYAVGVFNGVADGGSGDFETADDEKDVAARLFAHPFRNSDNEWLQGLGVGISGTFGNQEGALRSYTSAGQQTIFSYLAGTGAAGSPSVVADGDHWRLSPQAYYYKGSFGLLAEYAISKQDVRRTEAGNTFGKVEHTGWQVAASYFLTGEDNSYKAVQPIAPFSFGQEGWGAFELAARVSQLDLDDDAFPLYASPAASATKATSYGVGVNWHLNRNVKLSLNYEYSDFSGGTSPLLVEDEQAIFTRAQLAF